MGKKEATTTTTTKKKEKKVKKAKGGKTVLIADLAEEFGIPGRRVRMAIRSIGMKAPSADTPEGKFGPKAKYIFEEGSSELKKVRAALKEEAAREITPRKRKAKKNKDVDSGVEDETAEIEDDEDDEIEELDDEELLDEEDEEDED